MFSNLKTKKRITQLLIALVVVALTATGSVVLFSNLMPEARAADYTVSSASQWNAAVTSGNKTVNITLAGDIKSTTTSSLGLSPIPSGVTVNLDMKGYTIQWYNVATGNKDIITTSYPFANTYWGMITNNGTLNISGDGTISQYQVRYNNKNSSNQSEYGHKSAAIVNTGVLNIDAGITVENFAGQSNTDGDKYQDMFIYSHGIYNTGTVTSSGTIQSGAFAQGVTNYSDNGFAYAFSYGVFGGDVNITGGNVFSEAKSGYTEKQGLTTGQKDEKVFNFAVGVFSNNAIINGNSSITTNSLSWRDDTGDYNLWKNGWNMSWGVGVLYSGTNYPYIGADVSINASFTHHTGGTVNFPTLNGKTSLFNYTRESNGDPGSYSRRAYAVAGIPASNTTAMAGLQEGEVGPETALGVSANGGNASSTNYRSEFAMYSGSTSTVSVSGESQSGANSGETKYSYVSMGGPGTTGGQFVVFYRYWSPVSEGGKIERISRTPDTSINSAMTFSPASGVFSASTSVSKSGGGTIVNPAYYELKDIQYKLLTDGTYGTGESYLLTSGKNLPGCVTATSFKENGNFAVTHTTTANSYVIFVDYQEKDATNVTVIASDNTTNKKTDFTIEYTGAEIVPGVDFPLNVVDMGSDPEFLAANADKYTLATDYYAIKNANESGKVTLRYSFKEFVNNDPDIENGYGQEGQLPKNAGKYTIKVVVPSDVDSSRTGSGNRNGGTFYLTCTITQATPTIKDITENENKSGTYGSNMAELIPTSDYTITGKNNENMTGTWSYDGFAATDCPTIENASEKITLRWTPTGDCAANYKVATKSVSLNLAKREVTVAPADSTVTYGAKNPNYVLNYTNLAGCDTKNEATWLANSTFEVNYNGTWQSYNENMLPGKYDMRIASFGGDTANNNFSKDGVSTLTINKAPLYYNATATNKVYDGKAEVNVTLEYNNGAVNGEQGSVTQTINNVTGTLENANAGVNKAVTVVTSGLDYALSDRYYIAIQNSPTVTVSKATPTATPEAYNFTYDSERTLSKVTVSGETSVEGVWSWKDGSIVPSFDVKEYTAVFTPAAANNYETIEVPVTINVAKKEVVISVDNKTVAYGDASPALNLVYTGFTGSDNEFNVATAGSVSASTDYSMGKNVGTYPITIKMTDYTAANYSFRVATDCVINVVKKNITITAPSGSVTYGDNAIQFGINELIVEADAIYNEDTLAGIHDEAKFEISTAYERGNDAGKYPVTVVNTAEAKNYEFTFVDGTLTVNKAVLTVTVKDMTIDYNTPTPSGFDWEFSGYKFDTDADPSGRPTLSTQYKKGDDAGQYAISIGVGNLSHTNYTFELVGGTLTVQKLSLNTEGKAVSATIVHGEAYSQAVFTATSITVGNETTFGTFTLKDSTAKADYTIAVEDDFGNGKYVVAEGIFTPTDSDNYNPVGITVNLFITPHEITGAPVITGTAMVDNVITASIAGMTPATADCYTYRWYVAGVQSGTASTYTVKESDVGKEIYVEVKAVEDKGYTGSAKSASVTAVVKFTHIVSAEQLDITGISDTYIYDGATHGATVTVKSAYAGKVSENITVYYNGSTAKPYNAGTYIVTVDVGVPDVPENATQAQRDEYYGPVSGLEIGTITIGKRAYTATFEVADKIYDGTRKVEYFNVTDGGRIEPDDVYLDSSLITIVFNKASVGTHAIDISGVRLAGAAAANYKLEVESTTATISKRTLNATATGVTRPYNGSAQVEVVFTNISGYASIDSATTVYLANSTATAASTNAGTWNITDIDRDILRGTSAGNYELVITNEGSAEVTISKATPVVTPPVVDGLVYNANRTLANIDLEDYYTKDSNGYWQFDDTTVTPSVKKTQYAATYISTNGNYSNYSTNITVYVTPKAVVLTAVDTTVSYGKAASFSVVADGFTGNDSLATMGGTQPTFVCTYSMGENIGDYSIKINHNLDSNGNYVFETVNGTLKVVPADLYVSATATDRDYNGTDGVEVKFAIASGKYQNDDVAISTTSANGTASSVNAGTRTVTYTAPTLTGSKANNYNLVLTPASGILTVTINKLDPTGYVFPTSATIPFGYALSWAQVSDDAKGDGTFAFASDSEVPDALGTYSYEVVFTPTDSVNYKTVSKNIPLTVTKCTVNYVVGVSGSAQVGQKLSVSFTGLPSKAYEYVQYQWYRDTDVGPIAITGANTSTYSPTEADVGYEIFCFTYFETGAPYVFEEGMSDIIGEIEGIFGSTSGSIAEENLTFWQRLVRWIENIIQALTGIMWSFGM